MDDNKNNYTQIPNELMDILMSNALSRNEIRVLLFIARKTYGFHKESDQISLTQFQNKLGLSRQGIVSILKRLELVNLCRLVNKGNSRIASSEWLIDTTDYPEKLVKLSGLVKFMPINRSTYIDTQKKYTKERVSENNSFTSKEDFWDKNITQVLSTLQGISPKVIEDSRAAFVLSDKAKLVPGYMRAILNNKQKESAQKGGLKDAKSFNDPFSIRGSGENA